MSIKRKEAAFDRKGCFFCINPPLLRDANRKGRWKKMIRTDLAVEFTAGHPKLPGVRFGHTMLAGQFPVTKTQVESPEAASRLGKPCGQYWTVERLNFADAAWELPQLAAAIAPLFAKLLPRDWESALVVGLGNREITPDALGPRAISHTLVTRHFSGKAAGGLEQLHPVSAIAPGVLGQTGIETAELILALHARLKPDLVIAVDALAAAEKSRLCKTLQFSDTGIYPGSGVCNHRKALNRQTLGVPVLAIGVPTVIADAEQPQLFVTPREVDLCIEHAGKLIGLICSLALHPQLSVDDLLALVG
jgi:spore protease